MKINSIKIDGTTYAVHEFTELAERNETVARVLAQAGDPE